MRKRSKWPVKEQALLLQRVGELLLQGYALAEALNSVTFSLRKNQREELQNCIKALQEGYPFHFILEHLQFNKELIGYVYFSEQHGKLAQAFLEGSRMVLNQEKNTQRLKKLLIYPSFLIMVTILLFIYLKEILLPRFTSLFSTMNLDTNIFSSLIFTIGNLFPRIVLLVMIICFLFVLYYSLIFKRLPLIVQKQRIVQLPIVGRLLRLLYSHYFSIQLSYLLGGGFSINDALSQFVKNEGQPFYKELGIEIKKSLLTGGKLDEIVRSFKVFEKELSYIIKHGQDNGKLDNELHFFGEYCLSRLEDMIEKWVKIIQPCIYILIATLIVSMYLAIILPMFHLLNGI